MTTLRDRYIAGFKSYCNGRLVDPSPKGIWSAEFTQAVRSFINEYPNSKQVIQDYTNVSKATFNKRISIKDTNKKYVGKKVPANSVPESLIGQTLFNRSGHEFIPLSYLGNGRFIMTSKLGKIKRTTSNLYFTLYNK